MDPRTVEPTEEQLDLLGWSPIPDNHPWLQSRPETSNTFGHMRHTIRDKFEDDKKFLGDWRLAFWETWRELRHQLRRLAPAQLGGATDEGPAQTEQTGRLTDLTSDADESSETPEEQERRNVVEEILRCELNNGKSVEQVDKAVRATGGNMAYAISYLFEDFQTDPQRLGNRGRGAPAVLKTENPTPADAAGHDKWEQAWIHEDSTLKVEESEVFLKRHVLEALAETATAPRDSLWERFDQYDRGSQECWESVDKQEFTRIYDEMKSRVEGTKLAMEE